MTACGGNRIGSGAAPIELAEQRKMSDEALCKAAYRAMYRAMIAKDADALNEVLDDSFVLIHMTGMRQPKAAFIQAVLNGTLNYYTCEDDSVEVTLRGDTADLAGKSRVSAAVFGGGRHTWRLQQDLTLIKRQGRWLITRSEAGTY